MFIEKRKKKNDHLTDRTHAGRRPRGKVCLRARVRTRGGKRYRDGQRPTPTANHQGPELRPPTAPRPKAPTQEGGKSRRTSMSVLLHAGCQGDSRWPSQLARNPSKTAQRHHGNDQALNSRARRQGVLDKRLDGARIPTTLKPGREEQRPKAATHSPPPMRTC